MTAELKPASFDSFYDADGLRRLLASWADARPHLLQVDSIGQTWEGRDIMLATCTDTSTGRAEDKPALFVEANIHAAELTGSAAALHLLQTLLAGHGDDERVTTLLRTRTVYVLPRLCVDGAEEVLRTGRYVRSSMKPYPDAELAPGLHQGDIDGDGRSLFMRIPDPHGPWKVSAADPRLLVRRELDDTDGTGYRLLLEGEILGYDGATVREAPAYEGLDLAASFHSDWPDLPSRPRSSGEYSGSEPEIAALMRAVTERPNITSYVSLHTFGAVHLRPPLNADDDMPQADVERYEELGDRAAEWTTYPVMSYDDLKHVPYRVRGGQLAWLYHERGLYAWITELWNPLRAAGVTDFHPSRWLVEHPEEDDLALLRWNDEALAGEGFVDWYEYEHPQLGPVELGGWDMVRSWYNPPLSAIEDEVSPHTQWAISLGLASPLLEVVTAEAEHVSGDVFLVRLVVGNAGWMPTYGTEKARQRNQTPPVVGELTVPEHGRLVTGTATVELGHLSGRSHARTSTTWWGHEPGTPERASTEWVVVAPAGTTVTVEARHPRAGVVRRQVVLAQS